MDAQEAKSDPPPASDAPPEAITLPSEELAWAHARAEREGTTVVAVITDAVRKARQAEAWAEVRGWLLEGQDPITDAERQAVEREWQG